jgi:hypothetical protein
MRPILLPGRYSHEHPKCFLLVLSALQSAVKSEKLLNCSHRVLRVIPAHAPEVWYVFSWRLFPDVWFLISITIFLKLVAFSACPTIESSSLCSQLPHIPFWLHQPSVRLCSRRQLRREHVAACRGAKPKVVQLHDLWLASLDVGKLSDQRALARRAGKSRTNT